MKATKESSYFLLLLFALFLIAAVVSFHRYMILQDFRYFLTEEEMPDRFDISAYTSEL